MIKPSESRPSRHCRKTWFAGMLIMPALLGACALSGGTLPHGTDETADAKSAVASTAADAASGWKRFHSNQWNFHIDYPAAWTVRNNFGTSYFSTGTWKTFATRDSKGSPIVALTLPGSNAITTAQLRIGASKDASAVAHCLDVPDSATGGGDLQKLRGVRFLHYQIGDAAMSHYVHVQSYRIVHAGHCYAIDLWIGGTRAEVYDPPATPPFTRKQAETRLRAALLTFQFEP